MSARPGRPRSAAADAPWPWWRSAVVYEIYVRSFCDADGDGIGDLEGIRQQIPYLAWLGVGAIWLTPINRSPMADGGYDVCDYLDIDPVFGDLAAFDALLAECHGHGLRVLLDWVPNHTSDRHPWFLDARASRSAPRRNWYIWRDGDRPPNNWRAAFGGPAWTFDDTTQQWYLHLFLPEQPDLNWAEPQVRAAMHDVLRFWLDRGVDGFRADVVHLIGKDAALPDQPLEFGEVERVTIHDHPGTHELLREIRRVVDAYDGERMIVGEVNLRDTIRIAAYGAPDQLHLAFNFLALDAGFARGPWQTLIDGVGQAFGPDAWPTWVLSNHDNPRVRTRFGGSEARARAAAVLLLTLRGTPFVFQGDELGLEDAVVADDQRVDPGGRDPCRAPMPWLRRAMHGWQRAPALPFAPDAGARSVEAQMADPRSTLWLYRRLIDLRRRHAALERGALELVDAPHEVLAYDRVVGSERVRVLVNFGHEAAALPREDWVLALSSRADAGAGWNGELPAETALILRRGDARV